MKQITLLTVMVIAFSCKNDPVKINYTGLQNIQKNCFGKDQVLLILSGDTAFVSKDTIIVNGFKIKSDTILTHDTVYLPCKRKHYSNTVENVVIGDVQGDVIQGDKINISQP